MSCHVSATIGGSGFKRTENSTIQRAMQADSRCLFTSTVGHIKNARSRRIGRSQGLSGRTSQSGIPTDRHRTISRSVYRSAYRVGTDQHEVHRQTPQKIRGGKQ